VYVIRKIDYDAGMYAAILLPREIVMQDWNRVSTLNSLQLMAQYAHEVVQRNQQTGQQLIGSALGQLSLAAARGYVRAKLGALLAQDAARFDTPKKANAAEFQAGIYERALESLTQLLLGETLKAQRQQALRRAA
jgi:hypothetical protein